MKGTLFLCLGIVDNAHDTFELRLVHHRTDLRALLLRVTNGLLLVLDGFGVSLQERIIDAGLNVDSGRCDADLAGVGEKRPDCPSKTYCYQSQPPNEKNVFEYQKHFTAMIQVNLSR